MQSQNNNSFFEVKNAEVQFSVEGGVVNAVNDVSFTIDKGETLAIVGESGSGKSVTARTIMKMLPKNASTNSNLNIIFKGETISHYSQDQMRLIRGNDITMIFQEPLTSLNPLHKIRSQIVEVLQVHQNISKAREIVDYRIQQTRKQELAPSSPVSLDNLYTQMDSGGLKELPIILKADAQGSIEVTQDTLEKLSTEKVRINILHKGVGAISESDVLLASASNAVVVGFNVRPERNAQDAAEHEKVDVRLYTVIYEIAEEIQSAMVGLLEPTFREVEMGRAEARDTFRVPKFGTIAGSYVQDGTIRRNMEARLLRDNVVIYEGTIEIKSVAQTCSRLVAIAYAEERSCTPKTSPVTNSNWLVLIRANTKQCLFFRNRTWDTRFISRLNPGFSNLSERRSMNCEPTELSIGYTQVISSKRVREGADRARRSLARLSHYRA